MASGEFFQVPTDLVVSAGLTPGHQAQFGVGGLRRGFLRSRWTDQREEAQTETESKQSFHEKAPDEIGGGGDQLSENSARQPRSTQTPRRS